MRCVFRQLALRRQCANDGRVRSSTVESGGVRESKAGCHVLAPDGFCRGDLESEELRRCPVARGNSREIDVASLNGRIRGLHAQEGYANPGVEGVDEGGGRETKINVGRCGRQAGSSL